MLDILRRIIQEVNLSKDLDAAIQVIVKRVRETLKPDICSVYLTDFERRIYQLRATDGFKPNTTRDIPLHRGLIGLVDERAEPINLKDAPSHNRYYSIDGDTEDPCHGFLGVPIIQNRKVLGILVIRQKHTRQFDEDEVNFLFTLAAQLSGAILFVKAHQIGTASAPLESRFVGRSGATGIALGDALVVYPEADLDAIPNRKTKDPIVDEIAFRVAVDEVKDDLHRMSESMKPILPNEDIALFDAWLLMLDGGSFLDATIERIHQGNWAPAALRDTINQHARVFEKMDDTYLRERASDIRDLGRRVLSSLQYTKLQSIDYPDNTIIVGEEISPLQIADVPRHKLKGIISVKGSSASHVAILANAMGIPTVMGLANLPITHIQDHKLIVDGYQGLVFLSPSRPIWKEYESLITQEQRLSEELTSQAQESSTTTDGLKIPLMLNTGLLSEINDQASQLSSGVGLYRTELPFMMSDHFPGETAQITCYRDVLEQFSPRPVTLRTLDIGGDKPLPYFPQQEANPFLGWRGVRITLDHPEIFLTQIRAMLRANIGLGNLHIMLPMISRLSEVDDSIQLIEQAYEELQEENYAVEKPKIGVMIEVPSAVYQVQDIARRVDFLSVGTNDLTQYLLAVDRNNPHVADIYDDLHPSVLRALQHIMQAAKKNPIPVSICGELAGNPLATPLLIGMGVSSLSMSASSLIKVKWVVRSFSQSRARQLLNTALRLEDAKAVKTLMIEALEAVNLAGLVRPGR